MFFQKNLKKGVDKWRIAGYNINRVIEAQLSLVECLVWDQDAAGSSPVASTIFLTSPNVRIKKSVDFS